jgi:excisionase family DNA binding protein
MLLTRKEVAAKLKLSVRTIDTLITLKELPAVRIGKSVRVTESALQTYVARLVRAAGTPIQLVA